MAQKENYNTISMIEKACQVVEFLSGNSGEAGISQIAAATGLSKSTVFRILYTLQEWEWIERNPASERYRLGLFFLKAGKQVRNRLDLKTVAQPIMENLAKVTGETVNLGVAFENRVLVVQSVYGEASLLISKLDPVFELYCSGMGKLFLSAMDENRLARYWESQTFEKKTVNTITTRPELEAELTKIRQVGYSVDNEEYEYGLFCFAAPVMDENGGLAGAISVSGPVSRMEKVKGLEFIKESVCAAAAEIGKKMGYQHGYKD
ncbi:MAG: IclR family transcriptional regulator [Firmicutes bacterium]|nr:IclR family transcriptional regulator [Bacillota bacterium]